MTKCFLCDNEIIEFHERDFYKHKINKNEFKVVCMNCYNKKITDDNYIPASPLDLFLRTKKEVIDGKKKNIKTG